MQSVAEIPFVAGHVALDFVNTAEGRGGPDAGEALRTLRDLRIWGQRREVLSSGVSGGGVSGDGLAELAELGEPGEPGEPGELGAAIEARELLYGLFLSRVAGPRATGTDLARLSRLAAQAYRAAILEQDADGRLRWSWDRTRLASVRHIAVAAAVELLSQGPDGRLKQCPGDRCGWFFLDATKRGNRRWCSMSECGQEAKTARRRERSAR